MANVNLYIVNEKKCITRFFRQPNFDMEILNTRFLWFFKNLNPSINKREVHTIIYFATNFSLKHFFDMYTTKYMWYSNQYGCRYFEE